ncbi:MAG: tetratricopeptide repeat protein [Bryobacteraceae bacterium]
MMQRSKWCTTALCAMLFALGTGCSTLRSHDDMNKGVQAYKNMKYAEAINYFKEAVELDPNSANARSYLAMSYMVLWVPGSDAPDNLKELQAARKTFQDVLDRDPKNSLALASMASMAYNEASAGTPDQKKAALAEAMKWNQRRIEVNPKDAEAYYFLGVIAWSQAYPAIMTARADIHMPAADPGPIKDAKVRADLKEKWGSIIDDGIADLKKALDIDPENEDAMSYVNLLLRRKADLEDTPEAAKADLAQAEDWSNKSLETRKIKATRPKKKTEDGA